MKLLLIILTVMTWTVESKTTVSGEGEWPYDIGVCYSNTYNRGQVRQNDTAVLSLSNLGSLAIQSIEVYVKSNKSSGAGTFTVQANEQPVATKSGTFKEWTGAYDNEQFHPISLLPVTCRDVNSLSVSLVGTANSLTIEKYVITYLAPIARSVTLMKGDAVYVTLEEETGGKGVHLPSLGNEQNWQFRGWSRQEFWTVYDEPEYQRPFTTYYPENDTLWAVYQYVEVTEKEYVTDLVSGVYRYVNRDNMQALKGVPEDGKMASAPVDYYDAQQEYEITFVGTDTAYITYYPTNTPIGYSGTQMAAKASPWRVYHDGDQTLFYTVINGKNYVLWLNVFDTKTSSLYAGLIQADPGPSPMGLQDTFMPLEIFAFTCHPEVPMGIEDIRDNESNTEGAVVRFGIYELHIKDGKKQLRLR